MLRSTVRTAALMLLTVAFACPPLLAMDFDGRRSTPDAPHSRDLLALNDQPLCCAAQRDSSRHGLPLSWLPAAASPALHACEIWRGRTTERNLTDATTLSGSLLDLHCQLVI
ncbi:MAG: hypothetical protein IT445_04730 [Phycisphaeraceae bacterium]|nr:hypothetical protein [Phycisphaeraceae bacterium]